MYSVEEFPVYIHKRYWCSSNSSLPHLYHRCCFVSQLKKINKLPPPATGGLSYCPISLFPFTANFLKESAMITLQFPSSYPFSYPLLSGFTPRTPPKPPLTSQPWTVLTICSPLVDLLAVHGYFFLRCSLHSAQGPHLLLALLIHCAGFSSAP